MWFLDCKQIPVVPCPNKHLQENMLNAQVDEYTFANEWSYLYLKVLSNWTTVNHFKACIRVRERDVIVITKPGLRIGSSRYTSYKDKATSSLSIYWKQVRVMSTNMIQKWRSKCLFKMFGSSTMAWHIEVFP